MSDVAYPEAGVVAILERTSGVTDIVGDDAIYPVAAPADKSQPHMIYARLSVTPMSLPPVTQYNAEMTIACWADTYGGVRSLAKVTIKALEAETFRDGAYAIEPMTCTAQRDEFDPPSLPGRDTPLFGVELDFNYSYEEL